MATNWWEIGKPVQNFEPVAQEKKEQNWWEIGSPIEEPAAQQATAQPSQVPSVGLGPLALFREGIKPVTGGDPVAAALGRGAELGGSAVEALGRVGEFTGVLDQGQYQQFQDWADSFRNWGREIDQDPQTRLSDLAEEPQKVVPFIVERVVSGFPDLAAAAFALPAYIPTRANEILNERLKNDDRSFKDATVGDLAAATSAAVVEGYLDRFATRRLGTLPEGTGLGQVAKEAGVQAGTEAIQEVGAYAGETTGTKRGFQPKEAGAIALESAIVGGGLGAAIGAAAQVEENAIRRDIESRVRDIEGIGSAEERKRIQELRDKALESATAISAPDPTQINVEEGQTEPTPLQFGESYANRIFDSVGQYIPSNAEFKVEEKVVDGVTQYAVTDQENRQYGQAIQNKDQADSLALSLNNTGKARAEVLEQLQPLSQSLTSVLKGYGLNDIGLTLNNRIFTRRGEALTSEGLFDPVVRQVFLAVDAVDPQGNLDTNQRREALRGVLRHEVVHALRYLDLWKKSEWKNLETTVSRLKKQGTNKTYLEIAKEGYADQSPIIQVEEAVAELIRDVAVKQSNVAGKPRSLSERAVQFFDRAKNALTGSGFQTYEDIVNRFERGEVGARERGQIRTFRASEEQAAEKGFVPERLQRILKSPEGRNQFRADTIQNLISSLPQQVSTAPAMNSLGNFGIREARSSIDQVPVKIKVDEQEVPTRDSEGRLIYSGYEGPEMFGVQTRPTQEGLTNFWRWFGKSKTADSSKRPLVFYHGTAADISAFRPKQAGSVFITRSPQFAEEFSFLSDNYMVSNFPDFMSDQQVVEVLDETLRSPASFAPKLYDKVSAARDQAIADVQQGKAIRPSVLKTVKDVAAEGRSSKYLNAIQTRLPSSANLMPVYVKAEKPWDYQSKDDVKAVVRRAKDNGADITPSMVEEISQGNWQTIEGSEGNAPILDAIRELGYDSMYVEEQGEKNLAVFNPEQIKSAVGNNGDFSPLTPSIRESRVRNPQIDTPEFKRFFRDSKAVDEAGGPQVFYHGSTRDVDVFKPKPGSKLIFTSPDPYFASRYAANNMLFIPPPRDMQDVDWAERQIANAQFGDRTKSPTVYPLYVSAKNPFDFQNKSHIAQLEKDLPKILSRSTPSREASTRAEIKKTIDEIKKGRWGYIEDVAENTDFFEKSGYDSIYVEEAGVKNLAVFSPNQIKSAVGNVGAFDITMPSIRESRKEPVYNIVNSRTGEVVGQANTINGARRAVDRRDNQYGASVHTIQTVDAERDAEQRAKSRERLGLPALRESLVFPAKATQEDVAMAEEYERRTGERPYLSEGQLEPVVPVARQSIKKPYEGKDLAKGRENDPISGLPLNKDGTVTLYYPATNEAARRTIQEKKLRGATETSNRVYLTNESSGPKVMENPGNIDQPMDGANVLIHVNPSLIHFDQEYSDGRKDFFIQLAEGQSYADKMRQTKLFTLDAPRTRALSESTKLVDIERSITNSIKNYIGLDTAGRRERLKQARSVLKQRHNVGTLMGENGKLQKTRLGDYGLTYEGKSVASMGLGLASAQRINEQNLSTCPLSAICEGLCLGETSGQNLLYGGEGQFKSGPRLSQYLKTEALVQSPEDFAVVLYDEIAKFEKWANSEKGVEQIENEAGEKVTQPKQIYQPAIRLNVTSDFRPQTFAEIINAFPNVMFYDYTKLPTRSIAPNHHLTYSSTGASQVVNGETVVNPQSNWDKMVQRLNEGLNVAMAFTSRKDMPKFIVDERTGQRFQVWDGDNYDARFLDPKREDGIGMVVGLTNKDKTTKPEDAAKKYSGFFLDYDPDRDGDTLVIRDQKALASKPVVPVARESRRGPSGEVPMGPTNPGPSTNTDNTGAAEALNLGQPINSLGIPTGPQLTDTMPDGTVDISRARLEPLTRRLIRGVEFIQSAPDKLRGGVGLGDIAARIEGYYDTWAARLGQVNGIIRDANSNIDTGGKDRALNAFEQFMRLRENGRTEEAIRLRSQLSDSDRQLIDAWERIARVTGQVNLSVTTPEGDPMKVWDSKIESWRPIRAVQNFFPRTLRKEVMEVMMNSDVDPALHAELMDALIAAGRANTRQEADDYLTRNWFSDEVKNDYFAGVEKGRTDPLPEVFYDYSWDAATRYLSKWARRTSQIQYFGQELGQFKKDWFDTNIPKIRDKETQNYLNAIKNRIYEIESFDALRNITSWLNSLATATQLGNPISASLNLLGGTISNVQEFGIREIAKSYADLLLDWKRVQKEGTTLGILNMDVMNILSDHVEQDAQKYFSTEQKVSVALGKFANVMLTVGGFNGAENIVRASAMLAARSRLNRFLVDINQNPDSERVSRFKGWIAKEHLNVQKLILENGAGPETEKYMRRAVNVPQGSYKIDMTPVFVDTPVGRFLFKYQKFGTQINRFFYRHFLSPILTEKGRRGRNSLRALGFVGTAALGGSAILALREAFGYGDPGPDLDELDKALEDEDKARALSLILSRAWQNIMAAGSLGFFGNYIQLGLDWQDQQRVKNPMSPPGLTSIDAVVDLFNRIFDQKTLTARDLDEIIETNLSAYRAYKRIGLAAMAEIGSDAREVKRFVAQRDLREIREYGRRYTEEMDIEGRTRAPTSAPIRTPMTPTNKAISDALHQGDSARARLLLREAMKGLPQKERLRVRQSVQAAIRNRQPIQVGGSAPSAKEKQAFLRWARQNLPAEKYQKIVTADRRYKSAAARMGMPIG